MGGALSRAWLQACQEQGLPLNPDFNSGDQAGTGLYQIPARGRRRSSAAVAYLHGALRRRNLMLRTGAPVSRILVEKGRAVGIEFVERGRTRVLRARKEVILSAGAVATPKLLMLSGLRRISAITGSGRSLTCPVSARTCRTISRSRSSIS